MGNLIKSNENPLKIHGINPMKYNQIQRESIEILMESMGNPIKSNENLLYNNLKGSMGNPIKSNENRMKIHGIHPMKFNQNQRNLNKI